MPGVRNNSIELDLEAIGQGDPLKRLLDAIGIIAALLDKGEIGNAGCLEA